MFRPPVSLLACAALLTPVLAHAGSDDVDEGTYSTYSAGEASLANAPDTQLSNAEAQAQRPQGQYTQQEMFQGFWTYLSPYGHWVEDAHYGWLWYPNEGASFRPYTDGRWAYTQEGWTWLSDAPYAWAVYHYGRWVWEGDAWAWIPGYEWAPSWASFRSDEQYVGWAPMGPSGEYPYFVAGTSTTPWIFVGTEDFTRPDCPRWTVDVRRGAILYDHAGGLAVGVSYWGAGYRVREIPRVHHAEPIRVDFAADPVRATGASASGVTVVSVYRIEKARPAFAHHHGHTVHGAVDLGEAPESPHRAEPAGPQHEPSRSSSGGLVYGTPSQPIQRPWNERERYDHRSEPVSHHASPAATTLPAGAYDPTAPRSGATSFHPYPGMQPSSGFTQVHDSQPGIHPGPSRPAEPQPIQPVSSGSGSSSKRPSHGSATATPFMRTR